MSLKKELCRHQKNSLEVTFDISDIFSSFSNEEMSQLDYQIRGGLSEIQFQFVNLFPHHYNWIQGTGCPSSGTGVKWFQYKGKLTEDQMIQNWKDGSKFVGVSFGNSTTYAVLDIDIGSQYHWSSQRVKIEEALEQVGVQVINWYRSSQSEGLHGYIVFDHFLPSWGVACVLRKCLTEAGFEIKDGQLEIFPNLKSWGANYKAHRLPLQSGCDYGWLDLETFLEEWELATQENNADIFFNHIEEAKKWVKKQKLVEVKKGINGSASIWYKDVKEFIDQGWIGDSQTNELLGKIAIFHRVFNPEVDTVEKLAQLMEETAISSPGYHQFCNHKHHIKQRCNDWAKSCWKKYRPFSSCTASTYIKKALEENKNNIKAEESRIKIKEAISILREQGEAITQRSVSKKAKVSINTVVKHKDLLDEIEQATTTTNIEKSPILHSERYETEFTVLEKIELVIENLTTVGKKITVSLIAKELNLSRATIYKYWKPNSK